MNRLVSQLTQRTLVNTTARRGFFTTPQQPQFFQPHQHQQQQLFQFQQPQQQFLRQQQQHQLQLQYTPQPTFNMMPFNGAVKQQEELKFAEEVMEFMNRNKRKPKKANHGARPCSSVSRAKKKLRRHHYPK